MNHFPAGNRSRSPLTVAWFRQSICSFHPPAPTSIAVFCPPLVAYCSTWTHPRSSDFSISAATRDYVPGFWIPCRLSLLLNSSFRRLPFRRSSCSAHRSRHRASVIPMLLLRRLALWHSRLSRPVSSGRLFWVPCEKQNAPI